MEARDGRESRDGKRRVRGILSEFYGLGGSGVSGGEEDPRPYSDPSDINSSSFAVGPYYQGLLQSKTLVELLKIDQGLGSEIKKLDGDMKTLVYENYNKFISATETIRKMKSNVEGMEGEMHRLAENMDKISSSSGRINDTLQVRREKIEQLSGVHKLLQKLQFIVELPSRLRRAIQLDAFGQAVKYYNNTSGILARYQNLPSFHSIQTDCDQIMEQLRGKLRVIMANEMSTSAQVTESVALLMELGGSAKELSRDYLESRRTKLGKKLDAYQSEDGIPDVEIDDLNKVFLFEFIEFASSYKFLFFKEGGNFPRHIAVQQLEHFAKELFDKYFTIVKSVLGNSSNITDLIHGLEAMHTDLIAADDAVPDLSVADIATDVINHIVHGRMEKMFNNLHSTIRDYVQSTSTIDITPSKPLDQLCNETSNSIVDTVQGVLDKLKLFFTTDAEFLRKHRETFTAKIFVKIQQFFLFINIVLLEYEDASSGREEARQIKFLLVLASVGLQLASGGVDRIVKSLESLRKIANQDEMDFSINVPELKDRIKKTVETLLFHYIKLQSGKASQLFWKSIDTANWLKMKEPRTPRSVLEIVLSDFKTIDKEVGEAFEDKQEDAPLTPHHKGPQGRATRLAESKAEPFSRVKFTKSSIVTRIVNITLKSLLEYVRLKTFGRNGYQQMQIDIHFLKLSLAGFVQHPGSLFAQLDDLLTAAGERCLNLEPLDKSVVEGVCKSKLGQLNPDQEVDED